MTEGIRMNLALGQGGAVYRKLEIIKRYILMS